MPKLKPGNSKEKTKQEAGGGSGSHFNLFCLAKAKPKSRTSSLESLFPKAYLKDPKRFSKLMETRSQQPPLYVNKQMPQTTFAEKVRSWHTTSDTSPPRTPSTATGDSRSQSRDQDQFMDESEAMELIDIIKRWE